jgi:hypothetical protein
VNHSSARPDVLGRLSVSPRPAIRDPPRQRSLRRQSVRPLAHRPGRLALVNAQVPFLGPLSARGRASVQAFGRAGRRGSTVSRSGEQPARVHAAVSAMRPKWGTNR